MRSVGLREVGTVKIPGRVLIVLCFLRRQAYPNLVVHNFDFVSFRWLRCRHRQCLAGANIKQRSMPRTGNLKTVQLPFAEWTAIMRADVVNAEKLITDANYLHWGYW